MSDCGCIYVGLDCGGPEVSRSSMIKARKEHICTECRRKIQPGETYENVWGVWRGDQETFKTCSDCLSVRRGFFCEGWSYGQVWEDVSNHIQELKGNIASDCLKKLTKPARDRVCDMIEGVWEDDLS